MTDLELQQQREHKWHLDGNPIRTIEDARGFVAEAGFCLMYPERALPAVPAFIGAYAGSGDNLPDAKHAFADTRAKPARELMVRLLREKSAFEMRWSGDAELIVSPELFPYFYSLVSDRKPKSPPKTLAQGAPVSPLAANIFEAIRKHGPLNKQRLRELVSREASDAALDRALGELWSALKIMRVDYRAGEGAFWDLLARWAPEAAKEGLDISEPEAISALLSKYLESAVAATQDETEQLFSHFTSRSKVREAIGALLTARELTASAMGTRTLLQLAPVHPEPRRIHG
ncbi:MAG TPA: crosslink repair DNA glycosylase YcaQ family protein [Terriglobales bacterium]|jgi:23S rRNA pseudouridine2605 synthase|nr:crosslink repair DNA glycosylase YcaQ family protein [Terriglobales bacterium]